MSEPDVTVTEPDHPEVRAFWNVARMHANMNAAPSYFGPTPLESVPPPAWSYGTDPAEADAFVAAALADEEGTTTAPLVDHDGPAGRLRRRAAGGGRALDPVRRRGAAAGARLQRLSDARTSATVGR